jgi:hypothetical protein
VFFPGKPLQASLMFAGKAKSLPKRTTFQFLIPWKASGFTLIHKTKFERLAKVEQSSSLRIAFVNYGQIKFYNNGLMWQR